MVEKEKLELELYKKSEDGKITYARSSVHTEWAIKKRLMREKYNYSWKSSQDRNPNIQFN